MQLIEVLTRLEQIGTDPAAAKQFGQALAGWMTYPARAGVEALATGDPNAEAKGMALIDTLPEVALGVVAESLGSGSVAADVWKVRMLTDGLVELHKSTLKALLPLLGRREPAPQEAAVPGARVCDVAYLMINRWLRLTSPEGFSSLPAKERNAAIKELQASDAFLELL
ncbi:MAG: hypothetical protein NTV52_04660 [Acidobacteria bacterium]|nr:hypothetical protein [Acidobacteriota bacterium]